MQHAVFTPNRILSYFFAPKFCPVKADMEKPTVMPGSIKKIQILAAGGIRRSIDDAICIDTALYKDTADRGNRVHASHRHAIL